MGPILVDAISKHRRMQTCLNYPIPTSDKMTGWEMNRKPHDLVSPGILPHKLGKHGLVKQMENFLDCQDQAVVYRH